MRVGGKGRAKSGLAVPRHAEVNEHTAKSIIRARANDQLVSPALSIGATELVIGSPGPVIGSTELVITPTELVFERPKYLCRCQADVGHAQKATCRRQGRRSRAQTRILRVHARSLGAQEHFREPKGLASGSPELTIGSTELVIGSTELIIGSTELAFERPRCLCT